MVLRWFSSWEEVVSRLVAIFFLVDHSGGLPKALWGNVLWTDREGCLSSAFRRPSARTCSECYLDRAGTSMGRLFATGWACLSFSFWRQTKIWFWTSSSCPWFLQSVDLDPKGSVLTSCRRPDAHAGMKIMLIPSLNNSLLLNLTGNVLARQIFSQPSTHSVQTLQVLIAFLHTKKDTNDRDWTSTQASKYWYAAVSPVTDRNRTSLTADNATMSYEFTTEKENYPW